VGVLLHFFMMLLKPFAHLVACRLLFSRVDKTVAIGIHALEMLFHALFMRSTVFVITELAVTIGIRFFHSIFMSVLVAGFTVARMGKTKSKQTQHRGKRACFPEFHRNLS